MGDDVMNLIPDYADAASRAHWLHVDIRNGAAIIRERMTSPHWSADDSGAWAAILDRLIEKLTAALAEAKEARAALDAEERRDAA